LSWNYDDLRGSATPKKRRGDSACGRTTRRSPKGLKRGLGLAEGSNTARTLSQTPPNIATPDYMASEAKEDRRGRPG
jgi:leucyl aminopeptidase